MKEIRNQEEGIGPIKRRAFIKRTGGAAIGTALAVQIVAATGQGGLGSGSVGASVSHTIEDVT